MIFNTHIYLELFRIIIVQILLQSRIMNIAISDYYPAYIVFFLFQKQCILLESKDVKRNEDIGKFQEQNLQNKMP